MGEVGSGKVSICSRRTRSLKPSAGDSPSPCQTGGGKGLEAFRPRTCPSRLTSVPSGSLGKGKGPSAVRVTELELMTVQGLCFRTVGVSILSSFLCCLSISPTPEQSVGTLGRKLSGAWMYLKSGVSILIFQQLSLRGQYDGAWSP